MAEASMSGKPENFVASRGSLGWLVAGLVAGLLIVATLFVVLRSLLVLGDNFAEQAVENYFAAYDDGDFSGNLDEHPRLAGRDNAETYLERSTAARTALGAYRQRIIRGIALQSDRSDGDVQILYDAEFENGPATVEFIFAGTGKEMEIASVAFQSELVPGGRHRRGRH